jgi:hypothetical protein
VGSVSGIVVGRCNWGGHGGVQVADVESGGVFELVVGRGRAAADVVVAVAVASALLVACVRIGGHRVMAAGAYFGSCI